MSCGFGAVVLIFLIINHNVSNEQEAINQDLLAELRLLDYEVLEGKKDLSKLIEQKDQNAKKLEQSKSEQDRLELELSKEIAKLSDMEKTNDLQKRGYRSPIFRYCHSTGPGCQARSRKIIHRGHPD